MTTKRLYRVTVMFMVLAENETAAEYAEQYPDGASVEVEMANSVPSDWRDAIPYGGDDNRTCGEILREMSEEHRQTAGGDHG